MAHTIALANKPRESLMKKITGSVKLTKGDKSTTAHAHFVKL